MPDNAVFQSEFWRQWLDAYEARLPSGSNPFGLPGGYRNGFDFVIGRTPFTGDKLPTVGRVLANFYARIQSAEVTKPIDFRLPLNCTDLERKQIFVDGQIIDYCPYRPGASEKEKINIINGLSLHESMHLECSSSFLCRQAKERGELFSQIHNLIEDESIEMKLGVSSPGFVEWVKAAREYMFRDAHRAIVGPDPSLLNAFLLLVRYPYGLGGGTIARYEKELESIARILTPFPATGPEVFEATEEIVRFLLENDESIQDNPPGERLVNFLRRTSHHHYPLDEDGNAGLNRRNPGLLAENYLAEAIQWHNAPDALETYRCDRAAVAPQARRLKRWLSRWYGSPGGLARPRASGKLDSQRLHRIPTNDFSVFHQPAHAGLRQLALGVLVDESGSMKGEKIVAARRVAIMLLEALNSVEHVKLFIYGHTADDPDNTTELYRYWQPGWKRRFSLGSIKARHNNRDGVAINAVAQELKGLARGTETVLLVISDGQPQGTGYTGEFAVEHTRSVVESLRNEVKVIQIAISPIVESSRMFRHSIVLSDMNLLPNQMAGLLKRVLRMQTNRT